MATHVQGVSEFACALQNGVLKQERYKPVLVGRGYCRGMQTTTSDVHKPMHASNLLKSTIETAYSG